MLPAVSERVTNTVAHAEPPLAPHPHLQWGGRGRVWGADSGPAAQEGAWDGLLRGCRARAAVSASWALSAAPTAPAHTRVPLHWAPSPLHTRLTAPPALMRSPAGPSGLPGYVMCVGPPPSPFSDRGCVRPVPVISCEALLQGWWPFPSGPGRTLASYS